MHFAVALRTTVYSSALAFTVAAAGQPLKINPTPQDYVDRNGGGAMTVPPGQLVLDGHRMTCGHWTTILDPNLDDYAASYPQFVILNMRKMTKVPTVVKLWIYSHECGHLFVGRDENNADCFAVRRGRAAGWLGPKTLEDVCGFISVAQPDATHSSGADRCRLMRQCFLRAAPMPSAKLPPAPDSKR